MLAFLALLGAPYIYIYDISSLRVKIVFKKVEINYTSEVKFLEINISI